MEHEVGTSRRRLRQREPFGRRADQGAASPPGALEVQAMAAICGVTISEEDLEEVAMRLDVILRALATLPEADLEGVDPVFSPAALRRD